MVKWKFWEKDEEEVESATAVAEKGATYILKRIVDGKQTKVAELAKPTPIEELYTSLEPGVYVLHKYKKGKSGFEVVWGPVECTGDDDEEPKKGKSKEPKVEKSSMEQMVGFMKGLAQLKKEATEEFALIAPFFGYAAAVGTPPKQKSMIEQIKEAREDYNILQGVFGDKTASTDPIKYEGNVPIWLHPKLLPELIDTSMERIETRLSRWGVIGSGDKKGAGEEFAGGGLPAFPKKPEDSPPSPPSVETKPKEEPKKEEEKKDDTDVKS